MRIFVLRARKGIKQHAEIIAHVLINAFYISSAFRKDVVLYIVFDSTARYPITLQLDSSKELSLPGFNEKALLNFLEEQLLIANKLEKNQSHSEKPGITMYAFGYEKLIELLMENYVVYILDPKGEFCADLVKENLISSNSVFVLSDNLAMPKKVTQSFQKKGMKKLSLGKKLLFASQCITIIHYELDRLS